MTQYSLYEHNTLNLRPLRPRQAAAIEAIRQAVKEGHKRVVLQAPTGFGKTLTAAHIIAGALEKRKRPMFTCPAITLVDQTLKSFEAEGIRDIGVIQAQHERTDWNARVQIATPQTLIRRAMPDVDFILIDEVHEEFSGLNEIMDSAAWLNKIVIGLSATPWKRGMGLRWTKLIVAATIQELIDEEFLSPFQIYVPDHNLDRKKIKVVKGEFQDKSASEAMRDAVIVGDVVKTWQQYGPGDKTFMFCVNRAHAREQMNAFLDAGIPFGYIDSLTPMDERRLAFKQMRGGEIAGIASVGCLIRGVDEDVRCIIDAQPTKSEMRHVQKWGRGLRTADGKEFLIGLDHAGNTLALGMVTDIHHDHLDTHKPGEKADSFEGEKAPPKPRKCGKCHTLIPAGRQVCPKCGERVHVVSDVESKDGELILYGSPKKFGAEREAIAFLESKGQKFCVDYGYDNAIQKAIALGFKPTQKPTKAPKDEKQDFFSGLLGLAKERGYSEGWCAHAYREKFGVYPKGLSKAVSFPSRAVRQFDSKRRQEWYKARKSQEVERAVS
jgi:DNA repair protein RadD